MENKKHKFFHQIPIQIRFNDIDSLGHVNNAIIQEYFDLGRVYYFKKVFNGEVNWTAFSAIIASIKTDFVAPIFINDQLVLKTKVLSIGTKSFNLIQYLADEKDNVKAVCESVMVGYDHNKQNTIPISKEWRVLICNVEEDKEF